MPNTLKPITPNGERHFDIDKFVIKTANKIYEIIEESKNKYEIKNSLMIF